MSTLHRHHWTREDSAEVEGLLRNLVKNIAGVENIRGCSSQIGERDLKISFDFQTGSHQANFCYLGFVPDGVSTRYSNGIFPMLEAWVAGLNTFYPAEVLEQIWNQFPNVYLVERPGYGQDSWRYFVGVTEDQLRAQGA